MSTQRKQIRAAVVSRLRAAGTAAGSRVSKTRSVNLATPNLPAIAVYTAREQITLFNEAPRKYKRALEVVVECVCSAPSDSDDLADELAAEVEASMDGYEYVEDRRALLTGSEGPIVDASGESPIAAVQLTFTIDYFTSPGPVAVEAAAGASISWDLAPPDGTAEAEDEIDFPQE